MGAQLQNDSVQSLLGFLEVPPLERLERDVTAGNQHFLSVARLGIQIPGVEDLNHSGFFDNGCAHGVTTIQTIPGTSDAIHGGLHSTLNQIATTYALQYNDALIKRRDENGQATCP